jgi:hypothetical protein
VGLIVIVALLRPYERRPARHKQGYIIALDPFPEDLIEQEVRDPVLTGTITGGRAAGLVGEYVAFQVEANGKVREFDWA